jgi:phage baseplate assembly protein W
VRSSPKPPRAPQSSATPHSAPSSRAPPATWTRSWQAWLIRSGQILATLTATEVTHGEIPWRTDIGSALTLLVHQKNNVVIEELARVYVVDALHQWEPRVHITSVEITRMQKDGENVLAIRLRYRLADGQGESEQLVVVGHGTSRPPLD